MFNSDIRLLEELEQNLLDPDHQENQENFHITETSLGSEIDSDHSHKQSRLDSLLWAFRDVGYLYGDLNPLGQEYVEHYTHMKQYKAGIYEKLSPLEFGLDESDNKSLFNGGPAFQQQKRSLETIIQKYRQIYCGTMGVEFLHIQNKPIRKWMIQKLEKEDFFSPLSESDSHRIMEDLITTEEFEHFLHTTFIGQKRFSILGAQTIIPMLHSLVDEAAGSSIQEIVIGTTHRGRLAILNRILRESAADIFSLFIDKPDMTLPGSGDVKYHVGFYNIHRHLDMGEVELRLMPNPSHLESVGPVVLGFARGMQKKHSDLDRTRIIPVTFHGDAAFAGQGVVAETLNLSKLKGYSAGGTIHIIINNQVGFTTSTRAGHSSIFPTDLAKMLPIPIFHINGDDPETAVKVMKLALEFRQTFHQDVVIDLICYRKYGHNEGDEPSFTHPRMYSLIEKHLSVAEIYFEKYRARMGENADIKIKAIKEEFNKALKEALDQASSPPQHRSEIASRNSGSCAYGMDTQILQKIAERIMTVPKKFKIHPKLERIIAQKKENFQNNKIDWASAESLAFGSLLMDKIPIRVSGQDTERGTFSQRHIVWWEIHKADPHYYIPLNALQPGQAKLVNYNSPLSEYSVLGFEFGYSFAQPHALVIWEAQFGDFSNGAQVIIDNYIAASESKWSTACSLVLLLPHGYEGQGPEHSNGHLDRYLQLCAEDNMQVCNLTTPAQYYSYLRQQALCDVKKPLIIMTPKSLLRHPAVMSSLNELAEGEIKRVIVDKADSGKVKRIILCSGKIYYELLKKLESEQNDNIQLVRLEQLYPFPEIELSELVENYKTVKDWVYVQEEPENRGAYLFIKHQFYKYFPDTKLSYLGRRASASPAVGSHNRHLLEQQEIIEKAFLLNKGL